MPKNRIKRAFTLVEMLVVIAIVSLIMAMIFPAIGHVKESAGETHCASNLRQLGTATLAYLATWNDALPQVAAFNPMAGEDRIIGSLFGGKRGQLPMFGIDQFGSDTRPLNKFLGSGSYLVDTNPADGIDEDVPVFQCPLDRGQPAQPPFLPEVDSMYDFVGTSYTLNDHALTSENCWTLVPAKSPPCDPDGSVTNDQRPGGKMPRVDDPTKAWMLGDQPIYNYQEGGDRRQRWHFNKVRCNLCFVDGHVAAGIDIPEGIENTTKYYTFLPSPMWLDPVETARNCNCQ
jgi:prepilin-type N-terminal cleavage/methylation domain-containing protein/prepilin-type processing-associated H-X9-DG protein